jgi:hypothetical protein
MTYRITPTREYCADHALSYPDFHLAGHDGNIFATGAEAALATVALDDDIPWVVVLVEAPYAP